MRNIDIIEWILNNKIDPDTEIIVDGKQWFLSDVLEKHLKEQFSIHVVGRTCCENPHKTMRRTAEDLFICKTCGKEHII